MPVEFNEYTKNRPVKFNPPIELLQGKGILPGEQEYNNSIPGLLVKLRIVKDKNGAKFIITLIIIIAFGLSIYYGTKTYQNTNITTDTAPVVNLDQLGQ